MKQNAMSMYWLGNCFTALVDNISSAGKNGQTVMIINKKPDTALDETIKLESI